MIVLEFKDGPNKGKQIVLPTPGYGDEQKPEIEILIPGDITDENPVLTTYKVPISRKSKWKRFLNLFRRTEEIF